MSIFEGFALAFWLVNLKNVVQEKCKTYLIALTFIHIFGYKFWLTFSQW